MDGKIEANCPCNYTACGCVWYGQLAVDKLWELAGVNLNIRFIQV